VSEETFFALFFSLFFLLLLMAADDRSRWSLSFSPLVSNRNGRKARRENEEKKISLLFSL